MLNLAWFCRLASQAPNAFMAHAVVVLAVACVLLGPRQSFAAEAPDAIWTVIYFCSFHPLSYNTHTRARPPFVAVSV
jgi:hypothetical protein